MSAARESADRSMVGPVVRLRVGQMGDAPVRGVIAYWKMIWPRRYPAADRPLSGVVGDPHR